MADGNNAWQGFPLASGWPGTGVKPMIDRACTGDVVQALGFELPSVMGAEPLWNFSANRNVGTFGMCRPLIREETLWN
jgi:hypothetical protein